MVGEVSKPLALYIRKHSATKTNEDPTRRGRRALARWQGSPAPQATSNPRRVALIRRRDVGRDWELRMAPPVNRVVPIARDRLASLWAAFDDPG